LAAGIGIKLGYLPGYILEVAVHHDYPLANCPVETRRNGRVLPKVAAQVQAKHPGIGSGQFLNQPPASIGAMVVYQDKLIVVRNVDQRGR
jgi:hypothetical protein